MTAKTKWVRYLTHPQVRIDPEIPVPDWSLSDVGRARAQALAGAGWLASTGRIVSSAETKAVECARCLGESLGIDIEIRHAMHENDRSATGFIPPDAFETMADVFFSRPAESNRGWECAIDAQARIVGEFNTIISGKTEGDILIVGHGAVGTLLYCHLAGLAIDRAYDQPAGGGHYFSYSIDADAVVHAWRKMEQPPPDN